MQHRGGDNRIVLYTANLAACVEQLSAGAVSFRNQVESCPGGQDPDANAIELHQLPAGPRT